MEFTVNTSGEIAREIDITLTSEELKPYFDKVYREAQKNIQIKGYRKGNVPVGLIKSLHGKALEQEATDDVVQEFFQQAYVQSGLQPIGEPAVTHLHRTESGGLHFAIKFEVMPNIVLGDYKGLTAQKMFHKVTEEEVDAEIESLRERMGTMVEAERVESELTGVTIDLQKMIDGTPVIGNVMKDVRLYLNNPEVNPELKASLMGTKLNDTFMIDLETGENGESFTYEVTVTDIKTLTFPELDEALAAKALGRETATIDELREAAREATIYDYNRRYASFFRDRLIDALLERHPFTPPTHLVNNILGSLAEEMKVGEGKKKGFPIGFKLEEFLVESRPNAVRIARWAMLRDLIIDQEGITADEEDYEGLAGIEADRTGIDYERILTYMKATEMYADRICAEKAMQFLEDYAVVEEIEDVEVLKETPKTSEAEVVEAETVETVETETTETTEVAVEAGDEQQSDADDRQQNG
jgi:trigger factor